VTDFILHSQQTLFLLLLFFLLFLQRSKLPSSKLRLDKNLSQFEARSSPEKKIESLRIDTLDHFAVDVDPLRGKSRISNRSSVQHPGDGEDGDGGDLGGADGNGRVALVLVAVVDVGLDVVVGRVVVGLLHATFGVGALQDVVDFALHVLDHLAAVRVVAFVTRDRLELRSVVAVLVRVGQALEAVESGHGGGGEDAEEGQSHQELRRARHDIGAAFFSLEREGILFLAG